VTLPGLRFDSGVPVREIRELAARRGVGLAAGWQGRVDPVTGAVRMAWGGDRVLAPAVADAREAERLGRDFILEQAPLLYTDPAHTVLQTVRRGRGKYVVRFRQEIGGVPVLGAQAFVLIHDNGRVAAFGSSFHRADEVGPAVAKPAVLTHTDAVRTATDHLRARRDPARPATTELFLTPVPRGEDLVLAPVWMVRFSAEEPFGSWRTFVDAETGQIHGLEDENRYVDVIGNISVSAETFGTCGSVFNLPARHVEIQVLTGNSALTGSDGTFTVPHAGALPVIVTAELRGPYADVDRAPGLGPDASFLGPATPGLPLGISFGPANSRADERNGYYLTNVIHDFMKAIDPTLTELDVPFKVNVGRVDVICPGNAWFDGAALNFCDSTSVFSNTGRSETIIYHEYGHAVTAAVYQRNGVTISSPALDEGNSDVVANYLRRSPIVGEGYFRDDCSSFLRDSDNQLQWPDDLQGGSGHSDGRIIAGFHWDMWQSLLQGRPTAEADSIAWHTWHEARDLGVPLDLPEQVLWTFFADDDDGTLSNGTPNFVHICQAALNHGFECPEGTPQVVVTHNRVNHTVDGTTPVEIRATVESAIDAIDPATIVTEY
ncbi:MAG: hypothetical protein HKN12_01915, partial [Gemmatimonadetes bacterium]|nr:hypothetical protein [Gemmatimonadota bacterium]